MKSGNESWVWKLSTGIVHRFPISNFSFKTVKRIDILNFGGYLFPIVLGPRYDAGSLPLKALQIRSARNFDYVSDDNKCCLLTELSYITSRDKPLAALYISIASVWIFLWCMETELSSNVSQNLNVYHYK